MNKNEIVIDDVTYIKKGTETKKYTYPLTKKGLTWCILRTYSAGVWAGWYDMKTKGKEGIVEDAINIWYWEGASALSQVATTKCTNPDKCKFTIPIKKVLLKEIVQVIPATEEAKAFIVSLPSWKK